MKLQQRETGNCISPVAHDKRNVFLLVYAAWKSLLTSTGINPLSLCWWICLLLLKRTVSQTKSELDSLSSSINRHRVSQNRRRRWFCSDISNRIEFGWNKRADGRDVIILSRYQIFILRSTIKQQICSCCWLRFKRNCILSIEDDGRRHRVHDGLHHQPSMDGKMS